MSSITTHHPATPTSIDEARPVALLRESGEASVVCSGFAFLITNPPFSEARILARDVPPAVVAYALETLGIGRLTNYDEATLIVDWRLRLQHGTGSNKNVEATGNTSADVYY